MTKKEKVPQWIKEGLKSQGKSIERMFNDIDLTNPNVREAIQNDPTLTEEQKIYVLKTGSLLNKQYSERKTTYKEFSIFIILTFIGILIIFSSLKSTGFAISNFPEATPALGGLLFFVAGLIGLFFILKNKVYFTCAIL